jgi:uncharacterized protein
MLGTLDQIQMKNLLISQVIGRLACSDENQPYIVPVMYSYDGTYIYGQSNEGTKLNILRKNPNVCFEVDSMTDLRHWQSVVVHGTFEELKANESEKARGILLNRFFPITTSSTVHTFQHDTDSDFTIDDSTRLKHVMYRIRIKEMTGRFERQ